MYFDLGFERYIVFQLPKGEFCVTQTKLTMNGYLVFQLYNKLYTFN